MEENKPKVDPSVAKELKRILAKDDRELTPADKAFLRARKPYLGKDSRKRLAFIFEEKAAPTEPENPTYKEDQNDPNAPDNEHPADEKARRQQEEEEAAAKRDMENQKKRKERIEAQRKADDEKKKKEVEEDDEEELDLEEIEDDEEDAELEE